MPEEAYVQTIHFHIRRTKYPALSDYCSAMKKKEKNHLAAYVSANPDTKKAVDRILKISDTANLSIAELKRQ